MSLNVSSLSINSYKPLIGFHVKYSGIFVNGVYYDINLYRMLLGYNMNCSTLLIFSLSVLIGMRVPFRNILLLINRQNFLCVLYLSISLIHLLKGVFLSFVPGHKILVINE